MLKTTHVAFCGLVLALGAGCDSTSYGLSSATGGAGGETTMGDGGSSGQKGGGTSGTGGDVSSTGGGGGGDVSDASVLSDAAEDIPSAEPPDVAALQDASWLDG